MGRIGFWPAFVLCVGLAVAATIGAVVNGGRLGLPVDELLRVEPLPADPTTPLDLQARHVAETYAGTRRYVTADATERFSERMAALATVEDLNAQSDALIAEVGGLRIAYTLERGPNFVVLRAVTYTGEAGQLVVAVDGDRLDDIVIIPGEGRRVPGWDVVLMAVSGWVLISGAVVSRRFGHAGDEAKLLAVSLAAVAGLFVLSNDTLVYTAGRVLPALMIVPAVALLAGVAMPRRRTLILAAVVAAVAGALAPFFRETELISHPALIIQPVDHEAPYRLLLSSGAGLSAAVLATVAISVGARRRSATSTLRAGEVAVGVLAALWAVVLAGSALDYTIGNGNAAGGLFKALGQGVLVILPAVVLFRSVGSRWTRPKLATLVIDLENDDVDLRRALARALDDPSLQVLTSPDGDRLVDGAGGEYDTTGVPGGRSLTRIQSGERLVGGVVHHESLRRDPDRLEAVSAAAGLALEVARLNEQIVTQLDEVAASRTRILEASDNGRRQVERDLHDGAQQRLVALGMQLQRARGIATSDQHSQLAQLLDNATKEVRDTIAEIRSVARGAQPALLAERGLRPAVEALAERTSLPIALNLCDRRLPAPTERTAYFVIAEGLTNIAKHAHAATASVSVVHHDQSACVAIVDDGVGGASVLPGSGLEGLQDRVAATGGVLDVVSGPTGTTLRATIPCE